MIMVNMFFAILGLAFLTGTLLWFLMAILRGKKSHYSWMILGFVVFFLTVTLSQVGFFLIN
ncbi:hypothetical protein [Alteribacter aurantiacus]|uniref:hypothetical protein n=1 Tax=Alteribacter aurantiacus TaxID=254410 RepID=UPI00047ADB79|nr:hypothetical protein [Alteribacter aurantiacus]